MDSQCTEILDTTATVDSLCHGILAVGVMNAYVDEDTVDEGEARLEWAPAANGEVEDELEKMISRANKLADGTGRLKDDNGKFDLAKYNRIAKAAKQKQFDNILHLVLATEDETLDRLRNMSPEHKEALLNLEKELAERQLGEKLEVAENRCKEAEEKLEEAERELMELRDLRRRSATPEGHSSETHGDTSGLQSTESGDDEAQASPLKRIAALEREAEELKGALAHRASPELGFEDPDEQPTPGDTYGEAWIPAEQDPDGNRQFWRMMRAWDKETTAAPTGAPDGFISTLARLYGKIMAGRRDREACDCASWLARQLETAPRAPVALVGDTLRRFAREPGMRDRVDDVWPLMFGLGIWQVAKVLERRWPNQAPEKEVWEAVSVVTSDCRSDFRELICLFIDDQESDRLKAALRGRNESTSSSATEVRLELTELTEVKWRYFKPQDIAFLVVPPHPYIWVVDLGEITIRLVHNNRGCFAGAYGYLLRALEVEVDIQVSSEDLADIHFIFDHLCY